MPQPNGAEPTSGQVETSSTTQPLRHTTEASRTYPCHACGGELQFDIASQQLKCPHCGTTHDIDQRPDQEAGQVTGQVSEQDLGEALKLVRRERAKNQQLSTDEKEIACQNCGGHTTFSGSLTAERCPYCATPIQRDDVHEAPDRLAVDGLLPFAIDDKHAKDLVDTWIGKRWFAPTEFKSYGRTGSLSSVYTAYFTYDADTHTRYKGQRGDDYTVTVGQGDDRRTETRTDWRPVAGYVHNSFDDIAVFANTGLDRRRIEKLEPWPTETAKPYSAEYVAGHLCRTYDRDVEECLPDATSKMEAEIRATVERDIGGDRQNITAMNINWFKMSYKHLLLPIWLLTVIYDNRPYQVYMNGVTGEIHGARPYSKTKILVAVAAVALIIVAIAVAIAVSNGGGSS